MSKTKFETKIKKVGNLSEGLINNNYLILFEEKDDEMAKSFGFVVDKAELGEEIQKGDKVFINNQEFKILDISPNTNENLKEQTHVSFHIDREFDGPRQILLDGTQFPLVGIGTTIKITD